MFSRVAHNCLHLTSNISVVPCLKCRRPTDAEHSTAAGKNPLRRNCFDCGSTDKSLNRAFEPVSKKRRTMDMDELRGVVMTAEEAKALKKEIQDMSPEDRVEWYRQQADKRSEEDKTSRRVFEKSKGYVSQGDVVAQDRITGYEYEIFEDWALRQIVLKRVPDEDVARALWKAKLKEAGAKVIEENGHYLLGRFKGVSVNDRKSIIERYKLCIQL